MKLKRLLRSAIGVSLLLLITFQGSGQSFPVTGKITDAQGQPLASVTVQVKGSNTFATSKADGTFTINAPSGNATLVFSYVGYAPQEVSLGNRGDISISLQPEDNSLEDVVVVGYGTAKKSDVTGALSRITAEEIRERPAQNVLQALQGKAAGVHVSTNFKPGELPVLRVRGNRSIGASNEPLYVIDGIPIVSALGVTSFSINDINPNDIASLEILKDASATAIYGSRGANGVVLITTHKGKKGRITLNYSTTVSLDSYKELTDWMDAGEWVDRWRESWVNGRIYNRDLTNNGDFTIRAKPWYPNPRDDSAMIRSTGSLDPTAMASVMMGYEWNPDGTVKMRAATAAEQAMGFPAMIPIYNSGNIRNYNWRDAAVRQGVTQNHQISLSSGTETSRLSVSLGYYNQVGVQRDQDYKRFTANLSGDLSPTKWFTLGTSILASYSIQNFGIQGPNTSNTGSKDLYSRATDQAPYALPFDANGISIANPGGNLSLWNPLRDIGNSINERRTVAIMASVFAEINFTPWLKYRANFGPQMRHFRNGSWVGPNATSHLKTPNTGGYSQDENFSWVIENLLYFNKTFARKHDVGVTVLQSSQKSRRENSSVSAAGLINPISFWYDLSTNTQGTPTGYGTGFTENTLTSFMGRINYTFDNKYLLTISGRADGASVLAPGHKWDFFPSFAIAWKMQEESFLRDIPWLSELKPRFGYGVTGNSSVNPYTTTGPLTRNNYVWGSTAAIGYLPQLVQNPLLKWEETAQTNIGLDFGLFKGRLSGSIEWYTQKTTDLIFPKTLPAVSGYVSKFENIGETRNKGIEITLSGTPVQTKDFTWNVDLNWAKNDEEIIELVNGKQDMVANRLFIGQPLQVFYQYANAGIWGSSAKDLEEMAKFNAFGTKFRPGTVKVVDQNGDYKIDAADFVVLGTPRPKWTGGITNTITYKNWSLNSFVYFRWGQTFFGGYPNYGGNFPNGRVENDVWSWDNQDGRWPMPNLGDVTNTSSAMQYNKGSFGAVRNISLSYSVPKSLLDRIKARELVLNVQVINPFIFGPEAVSWGYNPDDDTNWSIASSNTNPLGGVNSNTILPQSFVFGLRLGF